MGEKKTIIAIVEKELNDKIVKYLSSHPEFRSRNHLVEMAIREKIEKKTEKKS